MSAGVIPTVPILDRSGPAKALRVASRHGMVDTCRWLPEGSGEGGAYVIADNRIAVLRRQHLELDQRLEEELQRPRPDDAMIADLKRRKLKLKDEIAKLDRPQSTTG